MFCHDTPQSYIGNYPMSSVDGGGLRYEEDFARVGAYAVGVAAGYRGFVCRAVGLYSRRYNLMCVSDENE